MKTKIMICSMVLLLSAFTGSVFGGTEGANNTFYGLGAGNSIAVDGYYNTFIGNSAGNQTTTGDGNTFIGYASGFSNTLGYSNSFLGQAAGFGNTTGYQNTFLGYASGQDNTTGYANTFLGYYSGISNTTGNFNTLLGHYAGSSNISGWANTFLGPYAGYSNTSGFYNTILGTHAGYSNTTGNYNVFLGYRAGYYETGSNKLHIANTNAFPPLIYGEFDNKILTINGNLEVIGPDNGLVYLSDNTADITTKVSRMVLNHYINAEEPVYLFGAASTATNNFVALGGGSTIGNAATQIDLFTASNPTTTVGTPRVTIKGNGYVGIGTQSPSYPLQMAGGAYTNGATWFNASSKEYKDNIKGLKAEDAIETLQGLNPVTFSYRVSPGENHVGFIAEEVPELVATKERKGLSPMDIVAVLTKVVQEQQKAISLLKEELNQLKGKAR